MDASEELSDALVQASFVTTAALSRTAADHDLSLTQLRVLGILRDRRLRITELAAYLGLEKSTLSGLIDRAERRGLVQRVPNDHDGRAVDVLLTLAGRRLAQKGARRVREELAPLLGALTATERRHLVALLTKALPGGPGSPAAR